MTAPEDALTWIDVVARLLAATGIGGAIGLNRELTRKPAGLRTHSLVALGSALPTVSALQLGVPSDATHSDAVSRVIQGVIAGIGFLGGGVIVKHGEIVRGLTTAANLWLAAAVGVTCGAGMWKLALFTVALGLLALVPLGRLEKRLPHPTLHEGEQTEA